MANSEKPVIQTDRSLYEVFKSIRKSDRTLNKQEVCDIMFRDYTVLSKNGKVHSNSEALYFRIFRILKKAKLDHEYKSEVSFTASVESNKKLPEIKSWKEIVNTARQMQTLKQKMSQSQDYGVFKFKKINEPIIVMAFSDQHIGSYGTDYDLLIQHTDEIVNTPNLFTMLLGDPAQMSIKMRSILEISDNMMTPDMQRVAFTMWVEELKEKIIAATWDNHTVMREEAVTGYSIFAEELKKRVIFHSNIGHTDVHVNEFVYKFALSHKFLGRSYLNRTHGQQRYARHEGQDREIIMAGDSHQWGISQYHDGSIERLAINAGTLQTNSGYAKRHFSLNTIPYMPCVVIHHDKKLFVPFRNLAEAQSYCEGYKKLNGNKTKK